MRLMPVKKDQENSPAISTHRARTQQEGSSLGSSSLPDMEPASVMILDKPQNREK